MYIEVLFQSFINLSGFHLMFFGFIPITEVIKDSFIRKDRLKIYNEDCVLASKRHLDNESVDLIICDPPFGIDESRIGKQYKRKKSKVLKGYVEAPNDYYQFSLDWITEAKRVLKHNGTMYIVSGYNNLDLIGRALRELELVVTNEIIWKYPFGVFCWKKYITSHYSIYRVVKSKKSRPTFNTFCRFDLSQRDENGRSLLNKDLEDVWHINKEYHPNQIRNINKLPDELVKKMVEYSSNPDDLVADYFMGNFTTAKVGRKLGRRVWGCELNKNAFDYFLPEIKKIKYGSDLKLQVDDSIHPEMKIRTITIKPHYKN